MSSTKKNLLSLNDYTPEEIREIIALSLEMKKKRFSGAPRSFEGKTGILIFEKPSLRTRVSFETGVYELGGHTINLQPNTIKMGSRETVEDVARNLERWVHLIVARTFSHNTVVELGQHSNVPVINALTDLFHPCQALAFAQTLFEKIPDPTDATVAFVGDGNNVCNSLMILCAKLQIHFKLICPPGYESPTNIIEQCKKTGEKTGTRVSVSHSIEESITDANVIYTDVWTSMGQEEESEKRRNDFRGFQINSEILSKAPSDILISHCLPAHRGEEITSEVLDSPQSIAFDEAENRLHAQKAAIHFLFS